MKNSYEIRGDVTVIFLERKDSIHETLIDTVDLEKLINSNLKFYAIPRNGQDGFYARASFTVSPYTTENIYLHRYLFGTKKGLEVDHINHNTLDNRRSVNLREVTSGQNKQNCKIKINNKSGCNGVTWNKKSGKWAAYITLNKKKKHLGYYDDIEDAKLIAKEQRKIHYPYSPEARF